MALKKIDHDPDYEGLPDDAILTRGEILAIIAGYEKQFGMTSDEFRQRWKAGTAPDVFETNEWAILLDSLD